MDCKFTVGNVIYPVFCNPLSIIMTLFKKITWSPTFGHHDNILFHFGSRPKWKDPGHQNVGLRLGLEFRSGNWTHNFSVREKDANHYTIRSSLITKPTRLHHSIQIVLYTVRKRYICTSIDYNTRSIYFYILVCQVLILSQAKYTWYQIWKIEVNGDHWRLIPIYSDSIHNWLGCYYKSYYNLDSVYFCLSVLILLCHLWSDNYHSLRCNFFKHQSLQK